MPSIATVIGVLSASVGHALESMAQGGQGHTDELFQTHIVPRRAGLPPRVERGRCEDCCAMIPSFLLRVDQYYVMGPGPRADVPFCFHHLGTPGAVRDRAV